MATRSMNSIRETTLSELARLGIEEQTEGLSAGVYEMFDDDGEIDLIDTGLLSVNCQCLVVATSLDAAQKLIDRTDPAASGCDDTHLWLPIG